MSMTTLRDALKAALDTEIGTVTGDADTGRLSIAQAFAETIFPYISPAAIGTAGLVKTDVASADPVVYLKSSVDTLLALKSDVGHTHTFASLTSKPTTLSGYGIADAYTAATVDAHIASLAAGTGASGTWGINITGNAGTATLAASATTAAATTQSTFGRVRTNGLDRGTYGSISVHGADNNYAGIDFTDASATFMISLDGLSSGVFREGIRWEWLWTNGVLTIGTVPGAQVSGDIAGNAANSTAFPLNQSVANTAAPLFADIYCTNWFRPQSSGGLYWQSYNAYLYRTDQRIVKVTGSTSSNEGGVHMYKDYETSFRGGMIWDSTGVGLLNDVGVFAVRLNYGAGTGGSLAGDWTTGGNATATNFFQSSSRALKQDIEPFEDAFRLSAVDLVRSSRVVRFAYKTRPSETRVGIIAEDTHPLLTGTTRKHLDHGNTIGVLLRAVQELGDRVERLEATVGYLRAAA